MNGHGFVEAEVDYRHAALMAQVRQTRRAPRHRWAALFGKRLPHHSGEAPSNLRESTLSAC
jgi:hypothetical protein